MTLKDTVDMMCSSNYANRLKAEYYQISIRCQGLKTMLEKWDNSTLPFTPTAERGIYDLQMTAMENYKQILEKRLSAEGIDITNL